MERYMGHIIRSAEKRTEHFLKTQVQDQSRPDYGGMEGEMVEAKPVIYVLAAAVSVYCHPVSRFYHQEELLTAMNLAMDFVIRCQRHTGGFDYPSCNFNSAADTSFCFKRLFSGFQVLKQWEKDSHHEGVEALKEKYLFVMKKSLHLIAAGGFHTPNHRWGIGAALMQGAGLFAEDKAFAGALMARAEQYLAEGIDGNNDGEYAERSAGNYNAVVNQSMMSMYEASKDGSFLGYVARNLHMMLTYIDPDDTIFTLNSTRQDQGKAEYPDLYFYQYLYMAVMTASDGPAGEEGAPYREFHEEFHKAAHKIIHDNRERGDLAPDCLHILMGNQRLADFHFQGIGFLGTYRRFFEESGVLRVKKKGFGYSVLRGKHAFLFLKVCDFPVFIRIGESIGRVRSFIPDHMELGENGCVLESVVNAEYYLPFHQPQAVSDWWKMDHGTREVLVDSQLRMRVLVFEEEDGLRITVKTEGLDRVPIRVQVGIPSGAVLEHPCFRLKAGKGEEMVLRDGYVDIHYHDQTLQLGPGFGSHAFGGHYDGEEKLKEGYTILLNDYTPFERTFWLKVK